MTQGSPGRPDAVRCAFFFDLDGTLAPIAARPEAAAVPASTLGLLQRLADTAAGALAIVSGRSIDTVDRLLHPLRLPAAGLHGAQWRGPDGLLWELPVDRARAGMLRARLDAVASRHPGARLEDKGISFAVHYRGAPQHEAGIRHEVAAAAAAFSSDYAVQPGKMVMEIRPRGVDKGRAVEQFMAVAPFASRLPVMAGDDLTDEPAFAAVARLGGVSIKIGDGDTAASWRLSGPAALADWLAGLLAQASPRSAEDGG